MSVTKEHMLVYKLARTHTQTAPLQSEATHESGTEMAEKIQMTSNLFSLFRWVPFEYCIIWWVPYRFKAKGMDIGNADGEADALHGSDNDEHDGDPYDDDDGTEDIDLLRAKEAQYERPICSVNMYDIKSKFGSGHSQSKEERREERKQEVDRRNFFRQSQTIHTHTHTHSRVRWPVNSCSD